MSRKIAILSLIFVCCCSFYAYTQEDDDNNEPSNRIVCMYGNKILKTDEVISLFYATQLPHFQDPRAPRFLFYDKKHKVALGIGGYVKLTASLDFKGITNNVDFYTYTIPVPNNPVQSGQFQMDASTSRLFLKLVGKSKKFGEYMAYIESDFRGPGNSFRLRQAYVDMLGFIAGQTWSTFTDIITFPPSIDLEGPSPNTAFRNLQVRYTRSFGKHWTAAIAIENPDVTMTANEYTKFIPQRMPDIPMYVQYGWGEKNHVRLSGVLRGMSYRNMVINKNRMKMGWGVQASGIANITSKLIFFFHGLYGRGVAEYLADVSKVNLDMVYDPARPGDMTLPPVWGAYGGLRYNISKSFFVSSNYGQVRVYNSDGFYVPQNYRYGQYVVGNLFWNISPNCQLGLEYLWGRRVNMNGEEGKANRLQAMVQYNF